MKQTTALLALFGLIASSQANIIEHIASNFVSYRRDGFDVHVGKFFDLSFTENRRTTNINVRYSAEGKAEQNEFSFTQQGLKVDLAHSGKVRNMFVVRSMNLPFAEFDVTTSLVANPSAKQLSWDFDGSFDGYVIANQGSFGLKRLNIGRGGSGNARVALVGTHTDGPGIANYRFILDGKVQNCGNPQYPVIGGGCVIQVGGQGKINGASVGQAQLQYTAPSSFSNLEWTVVAASGEYRVRVRVQVDSNQQFVRLFAGQYSGSWHEIQVVKLPFQARFQVIQEAAAAYIRPFAYLGEAVVEDPEALLVGLIWFEQTARHLRGAFDCTDVVEAINVEVYGLDVVRDASAGCAALSESIDEFGAMAAQAAPQLRLAVERLLSSSTSDSYRNYLSRY